MLMFIQTLNENTSISSNPDEMFHKLELCHFDCLLEREYAVKKKKIMQSMMCPPISVFTLVDERKKWKIYWPVESSPLTIFCHLISSGVNRRGANVQNSIETHTYTSTHSNWIFMHDDWLYFDHHPNYLCTFRLDFNLIAKEILLIGIQTNHALDVCKHANIDAFSDL